jgi:hypothetical protein
MGPFHRYGGVVAVHALSREHHRFDMPERRFQRAPDGPDRTSQRRDAERCPLSGEAPRLAVERLVLTEFLIDDQPVGWAGEGARDDVERRGILVDCLAIATDEFLPDILDHLMSARKALQRLGDRLSKLCKPRPAAPRAGRLRGIPVTVLAFAASCSARSSCSATVASKSSSSHSHLVEQACHALRPWRRRWCGCVSQSATSDARYTPQ